jgi:uncharacterized RDD family membrane protein YckC
MESGPPPPDRPDRDDAPGEGPADAGAPQYPTPGPDTPSSPQAPAAPAGGPQAPAPGPQAPPAYAPGPEAAPAYGGPTPPGGWQQPIARPQAGWIGQPLASWGSRVAAAIIDWLIVAVPATILFSVLVAGTLGLGDDDATIWVFLGAAFLLTLVISVIAFLYAPLTMMRQGQANGQTWGKQLLGIRVVRNSGESMSFGWAALREVVVKAFLVGIASSFFFGIPALLDFLWPLWDDENRALHDMVVQTHVVKA